MNKLKISVDRSRSHWDLNGETMYMKLIINCNKGYKTSEGKIIREKIFRRVEEILVQHAHESVKQNHEQETSKGEPLKPERTFTLQDMMDCWDASEDHYAYSEHNRILEAPDKEQYFKNKFNIDITPKQ